LRRADVVRLDDSSAHRSEPPVVRRQRLSGRFFDMVLTARPATPGSGLSVRPSA
jgi:hypothetical protein